MDRVGVLRLVVIKVIRSQLRRPASRIHVKPWGTSKSGKGGAVMHAGPLALVDHRDDQALNTTRL